MNPVAVARVFFDRRHVTPTGVVDDGTPKPAREATTAARPLDTMAGDLVALFEAFCAAELRPFLDADGEALVATQIDWLQRAPVAAGAALRLTGWVEAVGTRTVTFHVQAHDAQEEVCEGRLRFDVGERAGAERTLARKHAATARRQLFWTA